jgi:hypothetical protein
VIGAARFTVAGARGGCARLQAEKNTDPHRRAGLCVCREPALGPRGRPPWPRAVAPGPALWPSQGKSSQQPMGPNGIVPVTRELDDISYVCPKCSAEMKRTLKRAYVTRPDRRQPSRLLENLTGTDRSRSAGA